MVDMAGKEAVSNAPALAGGEVGDRVAQHAVEPAGNPVQLRGQSLLQHVGKGRAFLRGNRPEGQQGDRAREQEPASE
jgi:hypothetical protein